MAPAFRNHPHCLPGYISFMGKKQAMDFVFIIEELRMARLFTHREPQTKGSIIQSWLITAAITLSFFTCVGCEVETEEIDPYGSSSVQPRSSSVEDVVSVSTGEDYFLPEWVEPEAYSG